MDFEWNDKYIIGVEEIDSQHKRFLKIIKNISELDNQTMRNPEAKDLLDELLRYAHFHFQSEELLMSNYKYPKLHKQKREHEKILAELNNKVEGIKNSNIHITNMLLFLVKWFVNHTTHRDREMGVYINKQRVI